MYLLPLFGSPPFLGPSIGRCKGHYLSTLRVVMRLICSDEPRAWGLACVRGLPGHISEGLAQCWPEVQDWHAARGKPCNSDVGAAEILFAISSMVAEGSGSAALRMNTS